MSNEYNIAMLLAVHVTTVNVMYLCNEIVNTVGDFLRRSIENASVYSPSKQIHRCNHILPELYEIIRDWDGPLTLHPHSHHAKYPTASQYPNHAPSAELESPSSTDPHTDRNPIQQVSQSH